MAEEDIERLDGEMQRSLDAAVSKPPPDTQPRPPRTRLERWAIALRVMAWIWWMGGIAVVVLRARALRWLDEPPPAIAAAVLQGLFFTALGGILLYAYSYHLTGIDCIVENTAQTAEAAQAAGEETTGESDDTDDNIPSP